MVKIGLLFVCLLSLVFLTNTCSASVELTVTPVNNETVAPGGAISYYVNVSATDDLGSEQTENLKIRSDTQQAGWSYVFNPSSLILQNKGDFRTSILTITVPANINTGTYYHVVVADGYQNINDDLEPIIIQVEQDESGFNTDVNNIPEFPTVALPMAAILGLVAIVGRKKE